DTFAEVGYGGDVPRNVAVGDLNADGNADVVLSNGDKVTVLLSNGDGTYAAGVDYVTKATWKAGAGTLGKFDGDALPGIAGVSRDPAGGPGIVSLFLSKGAAGAGQFKAALNINVGKGPQALVAYDLNNDTALDLAVANETVATVTVIRGKPAALG